MFEVNVFGVRRLLRAVMPEMRSNRGSVDQHRFDRRPADDPVLRTRRRLQAREALTDTYRFEASRFDDVVVRVRDVPFDAQIQDTSIVQ